VIRNMTLPQLSRMNSRSPQLAVAAGFSCSVSDRGISRRLDRKGGLTSKGAPPLQHLGPGGVLEARDV